MIRFLLALDSNGRVLVVAYGHTGDNWMGHLIQCSFKIQRNDRCFGLKYNLVQKKGNNVMTIIQ